MQITRRGILTMTGAVVGGGIALSSLRLNLNPTRAYADELSKMDRIKMARQVTTICCYCSVGCGLVCSVERLPVKFSTSKAMPIIPLMRDCFAPRAQAFSQKL